MKNFDVIKEPRRPGQLGMIYYVVERDTDFPNEIAVYEKHAGVLSRLNGKGQTTWPKALKSFDGETNGTLKLHKDEITGDLKEKINSSFMRVSISEVYVGAAFMDMAR